MEYTRYTIAPDGVTILSESVPFDESAFVSFAEQAASYARDIRGIVRALWNGTLDLEQAYDLFLDTVQIGLTRAWYEGAQECGIAPNELTATERNAMTVAIAQEKGYIFPFLDDVRASDKAVGGKLAPFLPRAAMWANRYADLANRAKVMACGDQKLKWVLGPTNRHCTDCSRLDGKVKRASQWQAANIRPQSRDLSCQGYRCLCMLVPTDEPLSKGPLPKLVGPGK